MRQTESPDVSWKEIALVALVAFVIGLVALQILAVAPSTAEVDVERAEAMAYCNQTLGEENYDLYTAFAGNGHGGLHCDGTGPAEGTVVHLHEVPEQTEAAAYQREQEGDE